MATIVKKTKYSVDDSEDKEIVLEFQTASNQFKIINDGVETYISLEAMTAISDLLKEMSYRIELTHWK